MIATLILVVGVVLTPVKCINQAPVFLPGGDMARLSLPEDTPVGAPIYRLQGRDPEGTTVHYSVSGQHLAVDRDSGVVTLTRPLDRESKDLLEVIISITDEPSGNEEPNTVSLRREVSVLDVNDNAPHFIGRPYSLVLSEHTKPGSVVFSDIIITDADSGYNSEITLKCTSSGCDSFSFTTQKVDEGRYSGVITLAKPLDFETRSSYSLLLEAVDSSPKNPLSSTANLAISLTDYQDQAPIFLNSPFSTTITENTPPGRSVLVVNAVDGDHGNPRPVYLSIEDDPLGYFAMDNNTIVTSNTPIDRENPSILLNGGVYVFTIKATELINNELPGDFSSERVTVVITDEDDQIPTFNKPNFHINVSEDISVGSPLPGLNMVVEDDDVGENARYQLALKFNDARVSQWLTVEPREASGRTPVVLRLRETSGFDYDNGLRQFSFTVAALVNNKKGDPVEVSHSDVTVSVVDANDNAPIFPQTSYSFTIPENTSPGSKIADITAFDIDSGDNGKITYTLKGFGIDKFATDSVNGNLYLVSKVDYERQKSYSLSLEARDGGGRVSTIPLLIGLSDVNDNAPVWEQTQYQRTVREGATSFQPRFTIMASDADNDGTSVVRYKVLTSNSDVLTVDENTGEVKILSPVSSGHTSRGQYEMVVRAYDDGLPEMFSDATVLVRVGVPGNQRPVFRGAPYNATIPETAQLGYSVITVKATDPDGPDSNIRYKIANGADNFYVNEMSGVVAVSRGAILDPDVTNTIVYSVNVLAVDNGIPIPETAQATISIHIEDINNKSPEFLSNGTYVKHISERTTVGTVVLRVHAVDPDVNADLKYEIKNVSAIQKSGVPLASTSPYKYTSLFEINERTGEISVNSSLNHQSAAAIILLIEVTDRNAVINLESQSDTVEVTLYIEAHGEEKPMFISGGWTVAEPFVRATVDEERPVGTIALTLSAVDPRSGFPVHRFLLVDSQPHYLSLQSNGHILVTERIDYESLDEKEITFKVEAISNDGRYRSHAYVALKVEDINDHPPLFKKESYYGEVFESAKRDDFVMKVDAVDGDSPNTINGFGDIVYSLAGESANLFKIDNITGEIRVAEGESLLDREKQAVLKLQAVAVDTPRGGANQKRAVAPITLVVLDVNDNAPKFPTTEYTAVVLENIAMGSNVINISATDNDIGESAIVEYELAHQAEAPGLFSMNRKTGELVTKRELTGKGRKEPYRLTIRAVDLGEPSLFTDVPLTIYIGDVVSNDGIPSFIHPTIDQIAYISENSSIGSPVYRAVASDPDDPNSLEGQIRYSFLQEGGDSLSFHIDHLTGLITTKETLDREEKENYTLIIIAQDSGSVPQHSTRQLKVVVTDIDDHKPLFKRNIDSQPLECVVEEEQMNGTVIGLFSAEDLDIGENADIGYLITYGNENNLFSLHRLDNSSVEILVNGRLDREQQVEYLFSVKCFKLSLTPATLRKPYNKQDLSERLIRIKLKDVNDNPPKFVENSITIGVRVTVPVDSLLITLSATDEDETSDAILYRIDSVTFSIPGNSASQRLFNGTSDIFSLNNETGELRTLVPLHPYNGGCFSLSVVAFSRMQENVSYEPAGAVDSSYSHVKIYVIEDRRLMKYVFSQPPGEVKQFLGQFKKSIEEALALPVSLNIYDTHFHAKRDGSLDFSSTSSCFHVVGNQILNPGEMENLLLPFVNPKVDAVYRQYGVQTVQRCAPVTLTAGVTWVQLTLLAIAVFIGLTSIIATCSLCCYYRRR